MDKRKDEKMAIDCKINVTECVIFVSICCIFVFCVGPCIKHDTEYRNQIYKRKHELKMKEIELKIKIEKNKKSEEKDLTNEE